MGNVSALLRAPDKAAGSIDPFVVSLKKKKKPQRNAVNLKGKQRLFGSVEMIYSFKKGLQ